MILALLLPLFFLALLLWRVVNILFVYHWRSVKKPLLFLVAPEPVTTVIIGVYGGMAAMARAIADPVEKG